MNKPTDDSIRKQTPSLLQLREHELQAFIYKALVLQNQQENIVCTFFFPKKKRRCLSQKLMKSVGVG